MWLFRVLSAAIFLLTIILSIPIAFDVGGRDSGLAYSLCLFSFYFFYSCLKLATPEGSRLRWSLVKLVALTQWVLLPGFLIWSLNRFAVDANNSGDWVARTFGGKRAESASVKEWIFGAGGLADALTVGIWDKVLTYSTPLFQLAEGFCSLLVIQAAGQITRWLVNRGRSDTWMVCQTPLISLLLLIFVRSCYSSCPARSSRVLSTFYGESRTSPRFRMSMQH
jgi:hypothetical protein